ncbi:winged helix-turn-helix domain-containing protein [Roseovarius sp. LXJ103]|uniref:AfsR/SARP family transcriptional regulator n=1 Tax=Roseovarius carneus TaxID=2853164 RepID=UPI000D60A758|nr:BTAD domain-containing putative transcriptional regulator [Roseovarius carneus]MBZ8119883.1 winged helix-turn-helix domain-containing protein [Roseovarius carneus]PWE34527.1 hypothetical protein DD563_00065 [Pelagicola sp. LXJ1103]
MHTLKTFGGLAFFASERGAQIALSPKEGELLAYVMTRASKRVRKLRVLSELWPERSDCDARRALSTCLWDIRKKLKRHGAGPKLDLFSVTRDDVSCSGDVQVDSLAFSETLGQFLARANTARADIGEDPALGIAMDAIASYHGPFLEGQEAGWIGPERALLEDLCSRSCRLCARHFAAQEQIENAIACARRVLTIDPYHEGAHLDLIRLLALNGQRAAALWQYGYYSDILKDDLCVEPPGEAFALRSKIVTGQLFVDFAAEIRKIGGPICAEM